MRICNGVCNSHRRHKIIINDNNYYLKQLVSAKRNILTINEISRTRKRENEPICRFYIGAADLGVGLKIVIVIALRSIWLGNQLQWISTTRTQSTEMSKLKMEVSFEQNRGFAQITWASKQTHTRTAEHCVALVAELSRANASEAIQLPDFH